MPTRGEQMQADVLAILERAPAPLSAYDILGELRKEHPKLAPPTIYRALSALTQSDRVHRLESRNAFVACQHSHHDTGTVLSVCDDCGAVEENAAPDVLEDLAQVAAKSGFVPTRQVVEILGRCGTCAESDAGEAGKA